MRVYACLHPRMCRGQRKVPGVLLYYSPPYSFDTGLLLSVELAISLPGEEPASRRCPPSSVLHCTGITRPVATCGFLHECGSSELGSLCLHKRCFYPLSHLPAPVISFHIPLSAVQTISVTDAFNTKLFEYHCRLRL